MTKFRITITTLILVLFGFSNSGISQNNPARTGLSFLKIGAGGRAAGMGEAFTAIADDPSTTYWNPAGLVLIEKSQFMFTHNEWLQDITHEFVAVNFNIGKNYFGLSLITNSVGGIERRVTPTAEPLEEFSAHDFMFGISYARNLKPDFSFGVTTKFLYQKIYVEESSGFAIDAGVHYRTPVRGLSAGFSLQNFGFLTELKEEQTTLPKMARIGAAYLLPLTVLKGTFTVASDVVQIFDGASHLNLGIEYEFQHLLALRFGYQTGYSEKNIHGGFGIKFKRYQLDYAYVPFSSDLGNSHRISVGVGL